jgi:hypothetical protein
MNLMPPGPTKARLIGEFLRLTGIQRQIDQAGFFDRFCSPGGAVFSALPPETLYGEAFSKAQAAVRTAYEAHRATWQSEYEDHVNWEFEETELAEIVAFLGSAAGKHYQEGLWRMKAYTATNTEDLVEQIVREACAVASARGSS